MYCQIFHCAVNCGHRWYCRRPNPYGTILCYCHRFKFSWVVSAVCTTVDCAWFLLYFFTLEFYVFLGNSFADSLSLYLFSLVIFPLSWWEYILLCIVMIFFRMHVYFYSFASLSLSLSLSTLAMDISLYLIISIWYCRCCRKASFFHLPI